MNFFDQNPAPAISGNLANYAFGLQSNAFWAVLLDTLPYTLVNGNRKYENNLSRIVNYIRTCYC